MRLSLHDGLVTLTRFLLYLRRSALKRAASAFGLLASVALLASCKSSSSSKTGPNPPDAGMPADASASMPSDLAFVSDLRSRDGGDDGGVVGLTSDIVGKITVGYQGWFTAPNDGSGVNPPWWHFTGDRQTPTATDIAIKSWPDVSDIATTYATGFANLGNGKPATLFSSYDAATVDTHVRWMQENGIDTIALQRFADFMDVRDAAAGHVRDAAQSHGRKFYIMYDISG